MNDGGKILLLLRARPSVALAGEHRRDIAVVGMLRITTVACTERKRKAGINS
jgi:hypothetical protein